MNKNSNNNKKKKKNSNKNNKIGPNILNQNTMNKNQI